jgi:hypothetical protein
MLASLLTAALVAAAPVGGAPIKLASPTLAGPNLSAAEAEFYLEHLAQQLIGRGLQVTTAKQIATMLGMERQRQLLGGCGEETASCIQELGNALGVNGILSGEIGKFEGAFQVNLSVIDPVNGRSIAAYTARVSSETALLDELTYAAKKLAETLAAHFKKELPVPTAMVLAAEESAERPLRGRAWIPAAVGLASAGAGAFFLMQSEQKYQQLATSTSPISAADARALRNDGAMFQTISLVGFGVGAAALASAGALFFYRRELGTQQQAPQAQLHAAPLPGGFAVTFSGVLP